MTACTLLLALARQACGAALPVTVLQLDGAPMAGAVVVAEPGTTTRGRSAPALSSAPAVIDQRNLAFEPDILVIRTGTAVDFPNSDKVRHQVYSFSGAKTFKLALYAGRAHPPVVFDKPGVVTLGCNIHDGMIGHIFVSDSPWLGRTDAQGRFSLQGLPEGSYTLRVWHPRITDPAADLARVVTLTDAGAAPVIVRLTRKLKPAAHNHGTNERWDDY